MVKVEPEAGRIVRTTQLPGQLDPGDDRQPQVVVEDGTLTVGAWARVVNSDQFPPVSSVRRNLHLMVDGGRVVPGIDAAPVWGARFRNSRFIWRPGYGVPPRAS